MLSHGRDRAAAAPPTAHIPPTGCGIVNGLTAVFAGAIGGLTLANRIAVSPMCQYSAVDGSANDWHLQDLASLSLSGAGVVIVDMTAVEPEDRILGWTRSHRRPRPRLDRHAR
jgi:hypothetical protein